MYCRKNDHDITKILQNMYYEDNVEQIREVRTSYRESHKEQIKERKKFIMKLIRNKRTEAPMV